MLRLRHWNLDGYFIITIFSMLLELAIDFGLNLHFDLHNTYVQCLFIVSSLPGICFQWVDCVSQLLRMYPVAFEFSAVCVLEYFCIYFVL